MQGLATLVAVKVDRVRDFECCHCLGYQSERLGGSFRYPTNHLSGFDNAKLEPVWGVALANRSVRKPCVCVGVCVWCVAFTMCFFLHAAPAFIKR